jgi:hypothetical protein
MRLPRRSTTPLPAGPARSRVAAGVAGIVTVAGVAAIALIGPTTSTADGPPPQVVHGPERAPGPAGADGTAAARAVGPTPAVEGAADVARGSVLAVRTTTRMEQRETVIPAPVELRESDAMPVGETDVIQVGVDGVRIETLDVVREGDEVVSEVVIEVLEERPTPTITLIGTATSASATKNWQALAECESGGDPTIVSSSGRYHGLYQFDRSTWQSVGGTGLPSAASPDEQTRRAMALYDARGAGPWPTCGRHL